MRSDQRLPCTLLCMLRCQPCARCAASPVCPARLTRACPAPPQDEDFKQFILGDGAGGGMGGEAAAVDEDEYNPEDGL